jgi:hypothetical protein
MDTTVTNLTSGSSGCRLIGLNPDAASKPGGAPRTGNGPTACRFHELFDPGQTAGLDVAGSE